MVLFWCAKPSLESIDINAINDLTTLQATITQVSEEMTAWTIDMERAWTLLEKLQQKYVDLIGVDTADTGIEQQFETIQHVFETKAIVTYTLPLWAKKLGMTYPKGMQLEKSLSKITSTTTTLVYTWNYTIALQQAEMIAKKANLFVSKNFQQAQALAKIGDINYISGLDISQLDKGIVYVNHELLETNVEQLLSVSVDQNGILTLEATKYK